MKPEIGRDPESMDIYRKLRRSSTHVSDAKKGKYFEIELDHGLSYERAGEVVRDTCRTLLSSQVIEQYRFRIEGESNGQIENGRQSPWIYFDGREWKERKP